MDLPVWQALYSELGGQGFLPIAVALESRGVEAARPWIEAAGATYPCLIDRQHVVASLYDMPNVPYAVWIDEEGRIVRPPEPAGTNDAFRAMDRTTGALPRAELEQLRAERHAYQEALRDWVANGPASRFALPEDEARRRLRGDDADRACAAVNFRVGTYLWDEGYPEEGRIYLDEATRLDPASWAIRRQAWNLDEPTKSGGPEFWAAVEALGDNRYYPPVRLEPEGGARRRG